MSRKTSGSVSPLPLEELSSLSWRLRRQVVEMIYQAGSGHLAGSLSVMDILVALFFGGVLKYNPRFPQWPQRDRFLLSAGHLCPALYAVLSQAGFFPSEKLLSLRDLGSFLQGHPENNLPGIETTSGSLGQGLSLGVGMALAARENHGFAYHVFVLLSDGEHQEGQVWEAVMTAAKYKLANLVAVVDRNQIQIDGRTEEIMPLESLLAKYRAFNWRVIQTNGHDLRRLLTCLHQAKDERQRPAVVLADTISARGISFMEGDPQWHGKPLDKETYQKAIKALEKWQRR